MSNLHSNLQLGPRLGAGHFGEVVLGHDDVHGDVAVKVLRKQLGESDAEWAGRKAGLLNEGQRLSQATHRNVVQVHQLLESDADDEILLVMQLCKNGSLQQPFEAGPLPLKTVLKVATDVALGLQAVHGRGMLHRDVKPGNILRGDDGAAKIGDFGLVTDNIVFGYASQAGYLDHLPPEVLLGGGTSVKSDVWALGMTLYRLIHGEEWYSQLPAAPRDLIVNGGFARSLPWLPHVPDSWRRVIRSMMHDDPDHRLQNANQVITALAKLSSEPNWTCQISQNQIRWERRTEDRRITITWRTHSPRRHEWSAISAPLGAGRRRTLGGSNGIISLREARQELKNFFAA